MSAASKVVIDEATRTLADMLETSGAVVVHDRSGNPRVVHDGDMTIDLRPIAATVAIASISAFLAGSAAVQETSS
ncbi:hypothetical protein [Bosea sp. (in: a-proteobacteria)]|uniref:hypothetical protein n=1 Tax=Bosea sp. (in: a-proteobacteria) TaxID=1871050 RepID=UPI0027348A77|nr:hypothetical protein [Bosea sp. (in: a-proteobacteria)]MDP3408090.1 hypothetical protein [Bosea sp. (in: a-proteobacteria)]